MMRSLDLERSDCLDRACEVPPIKGVYVFLASQESSYINGEVIGVTGGKPLS